MNAVTFCNNFSKINNTLAFGKKHLDSNIKIRRGDGFRDDGIFVEYERNSLKDIMKIEDLERFWKYDAPFIKDISDGFKAIDSEHSNIHIYGLEDEYGNILALAKVISGYDEYEKENITVISHIQAAPNTTFKSSSRHYKGIGETLVSKIVQKAKNEGMARIKVTSVNEGFWNNSKLFQSSGLNRHSSEKYLTNDKFDTYISFVESKNRPGFNSWV